MTTKRNNSSIALAISVCAITVLIVYNMRDIIFGTPLSINASIDGSTVPSLVFPLSGNAGHAKELLINGRPVQIDRNGAFADEILLSEGYNIVEVARIDRFGKEKTRTFHLLSAPTTAVASAPIHATTTN